MNPNQSWTYLTPERMGWHRWTRKHRNKFKRRWRSQGRGSFMWYFSVFTTRIKPFDGSVIFHKRV